jgi:hypothetical protein
MYYRLPECHRDIKESNIADSGISRDKKSYLLSFRF